MYRVNIDRVQRSRMTAKCVLCGAPVTEGFLCPKCDKPRKPKASPLSSTSSGASSQHSAAAAAALIDDFPKAAVVPFPIEASSPAITSLANVLVAAGAAAVVFGADGAVKFVTDEMRTVFNAPQADLSSISHVERLASIKIGDFAVAGAW